MPLSMILAGCGDDLGVTPGTTEASTGTTGASTGSTGEVEPDTTGGVDSTGADGSSTGEDEPLPEPLPWTEDCTYAGSDFSELDPDVLCVGVDVPLDWDDPDSELITIAAFKVPTSAPTRQGQFWLLDGGPGGSGLGLVETSELTIALREDGWDVLVPAHRGTLSPPLTCAGPGTLSCRLELEESWGDGLRHFNTSQAAHDIAGLIDRERQAPDEPVVVYGISYGTMWAMHYGALHPEQADGIVLDSVLPSEIEVLTQEPQQQLSVEDLLQRCVDDPACGPALPYRSGTEFAQAVVAAIDEGECGGSDGGGWSATPYRLQLGILLNGGGRDYLPLMAALLAACTPETTSIFQMAFPELLSLDASSRRQLPGPSLVDQPRFGADAGYFVDPELYFSNVLQWLVMGTTVLRDGEDPGPVTSAALQNLVGLGFAGLFLTTHETWSVLPDVAPLPPYPAELPTLILSGRFDQQTPLGWALDVEASLGGRAQHLLVFDDASHFVIGSGDTATGSPCALDIMRAFGLEPTASLDSSCMDDTPQVDPSLLRPDLLESSAMVFGTDDPWSLVP
ncbi:MAG: alpha/beta fold hydrolase [Nannocystaceae bacterium]